jgi:hypothetical protein
VFYEKIPGKTPTSYTIDHSVYIYAFDTRDRLRPLIARAEQLEQKLEDLRAAGRSLRIRLEGNAARSRAVIRVAC